MRLRGFDSNKQKHTADDNIEIVTPRRRNELSHLKTNRNQASYRNATNISFATVVKTPEN